MPSTRDDLVGNSRGLMFRYGICWNELTDFPGQRNEKKLLVKSDLLRKRKRSRQKLLRRESGKKMLSCIGELYVLLFSWKRLLSLRPIALCSILCTSIANGSIQQTRNNVKYSKNKDRNRQRAMDLERQKIRYDAVRQAERLAGKYDPSGKMFNVGEVVIMADGQVKSKEGLRRAAEAKAQKEAEAAAKAKVETIFNGGEGGLVVEGVDPERAVLIQQSPGTTKAKAKRPQKISKKQQKRQAMLAAKPVPPKPVIPDVISIPEGEENLVALWDITDEQILARLAEQKRKKTQAAKALRRAQKEQKKLNKAMKALKKEWANKKIMWDPKKARQIILGQQDEATSDSESEDDSDSVSDSDSSSDSDSDSDGGVELESKKVKKRRRSSAADVEMGDASEYSEKKRPTNQTFPKLNMDLLKKAEEQEALRLEKKRLRKEKRKEEAKAAAAKALHEAEAKKAAESKPEPATTTDDYVQEEQYSKKRKRSKNEDEPEVEVEQTVKGRAEKKKDKKKKKQKLAESNDERLDREIEVKEAILKAQGESEVISEAVAVADVESAKEKRSKKKSKRSAEEAALDETEDVGAKAEKKHKKKSKTLQEQAAPKIIEEVEVKAEKKHKKDKKEKKSRDSKPEPAANNSSSHGAEQWNPDALTGDAARKDKFLRLLGAGKGGAKGESDKKKPSKSAADIAGAEAELERQYEMGMRIKHKQGGKRRGLGA